MDFTDAVEWWHQSLASTKASRTLEIYRVATTNLLVWLAAGPGTGVIPDRQTLDQYFTEFRTRPNRRNGKPLKGSYVQQQWRAIQQLYRFLHTEDLVERNPFSKGVLAKPTIADSPVPVFTDDDIRAFMRVVDGKDFLQRRDNAILRVFLDCGVRIGELVGLELDHIDFGTKQLLVTGKGSHSRMVPFNAKTYTALRRWISQSRPRCATERVFVSVHGTPLTASGVSQMLRKRALEAGVTGAHPHRWRHTAAHLWLANNGSETDLQRIMGWSSNQMVGRYAKSAGVERANAASHRMAIADRY